METSRSGIAILVGITTESGACHHLKMSDNVSEITKTPLERGFCYLFRHKHLLVIRIHDVFEHLRSNHFNVCLMRHRTALAVRTDHQNLIDFFLNR